MFQIIEEAVKRLKHNRCDDQYVLDEIKTIEIAMSQIKEHDEIQCEVIVDLQKELK